MAVHVDPGPHGYGIAKDDGTLICTGMTKADALYVVRNEQPEPELNVEKGSGISPAHHNASGDAHDMVFRTERDKRAWFGHDLGQGMERE